MRRSHLLVAGLGVSAAAVTGAASTAANDFTAPATIAGYGEVTVTGALVTDISYTLSGADPSAISMVTFTTSTDIRGTTARLVLKQGSTVVSTHTCDTSGGFTTSMVVPCALTTPADVASFDTTGFTVVQ